jgi:hypothetical protein
MGTRSRHELIALLIARILDILGSQLASGSRLLSKTADQRQFEVKDVALRSASSDGLDSPWEVSSDSEPEPEPEPEQRSLELSNRNATSKAAKLLEATELAVRCLYVLPLRKPAPMDRLRDRFVDGREASPYAEFDLGYIRDKFPGLEAGAQSRLARMITRRRQLLVYRQRHSERLRVKGKAPELSHAEETNHDSTHDTGDTADDIAPAPVNEDQQDAQAGALSEYTKGTTIRIGEEARAALEQARARVINPNASAAAHLDDDTRTSVAGSRATREIRLEAPPRPRQSDGRPAAMFECKYCYLPVKISGDREWRYAQSFPRNHQFY